MTSTNKQSQARTDTQRHLWHFPSVHHFLDHSRSHSSTQVRSVLYKSEMQMLLIFFLSQRERRPYSDWSPRSTPIWTDPNWTTPNWTNPIWTTPTWTNLNWTNPIWTYPNWMRDVFSKKGCRREALKDAFTLSDVYSKCALNMPVH